MNCQERHQLIQELYDFDALMGGAPQEGPSEGPESPLQKAGGSSFADGAQEGAAGP